MKKLIALLLLVCLLPLCSLAEMDEDGNVIIALDGAEVFFTPIEGYCLTRESSASVFNRLGMSQREAVPWMERNDVYALLFNQAMEMEIQVIVRPVAETNFDDMTADEQREMCKTTEAYYNSLDCDVEIVEMYHAAHGHSYVVTKAAYSDEEGDLVHMVEYFTCHSGYAVLVVLVPFEGALTDSQMGLCKDLVESLRVTEVALEGRWEEASADGIAVRFRLPEAVKYLTKSSGAEDWNGLPKSYVAIRKKELAWNDYQGLIMSPDAKWEIKWSLYTVDDASDLDAASDEGAEEFRDMYVAACQESGSNVSHSACVWIGSHRYLNVRYNYTTGGSLNHAEEHYTLQEGKGVLVTLVGYGEPAPEEAHTLLQDILESQIILVDR